LTPTSSRRSTSRCVVGIERDRVWRALSSSDSCRQSRHAVTRTARTRIARPNRGNVEHRQAAPSMSPINPKAKARFAELIALALSQGRGGASGRRSECRLLREVRHAGETGRTGTATEWSHRSPVSAGEVEHRQTWTCSTRSLGRLAFAQDQRVVIVVRVAASVAVAVFRADQARVQTQATRASGNARSAAEIRASRSTSA
jgi:hypothetical protein